MSDYRSWPAVQAEVLALDLAGVYPYQLLVPTGYSGKGLLSRFPFMHHEQLQLYPGRPDLRAAVDVHGIALGVLVVHPPPPRFSGSRITFDATSAQLDSLADLAIEHAPSVLLGDFNMTRRNPRHARFVAAGLADAFAVAGTGCGSTLPVRLGYAARFNHRLEGLPLWPIARVDYIWYTPPLHAEAAWLGSMPGRTTCLCWLASRCPPADHSSRFAPRLAAD